ncbi:MAG: hypothetical protein NXH75_17705, partial [Halobacteriovoraceae bacterium]|nr:hypothetical protein [Halobacteriovoraceae bacterium]
LKKNFAFFLFRSLLPNAKAEDLESYTKLTWPSDNLAKKYILRIYKNREDKKPFLEIETDQAEYVWDNPKAGKYYWEVAIKDYWERVGEFSNRSEILLKKIPKPIDLISPKHKRSFDITKEKTIRFKFTNVKSGEILFSSSLKFSNPLLRKKVKNNSVSLSLDELTSFDKEYLYWRVRDGERKSLRRRIVFIKPKIKKAEETFNSPSFAKTKISPAWNNRLYQKVSSVTANQTGTNFEAEASGLFVNIIGFQKLIENFGSIPWQLEGEVGKGVAFSSLDYFQGRLSLYRHSHSKAELQSHWSFYYGFETQYQTSFEETSQPTLVAKNNALFGGLLGIRSPFHLMAPQELSLELAYGTSLTYRLNLRSHWAQIKGFPFSTVIFLENLKFEDDLNELSRTSLGLAWEFSF